MLDGTSSSIEVVLFHDSREIRADVALNWSSHLLEVCKLLRIVDAFFEEVNLWFAYMHLVVHSEEAFTCLVERFQADWLER